MSLKTDYRDDKFSGRRKYSVINNTDGTISLDDVTTYQQQGDVFSAYDINTTNKAINDIDADNQESFNDVRSEISAVNTALRDEISALRNLMTTEIATLRNSDTALSNRITANTNQINSFKSETLLTFTASGWSSSVPYTQTVNFPGITASDSPIYGLRYTGTLNAANIDAQNLAWMYIDRIVPGNGTATAYGYHKKPTTTIVVAAKVVK